MNQTYVDSYYSRTLADDRRRPALNGEVSADICIIGGGMAGLATALGLAERGITNVVVLESRQVGYGASGRNGGFVSPGYSRSPAALIDTVGVEKAKSLYGLTVEAMEVIRRRIAQYAMPCGPLVPGKLNISWFDRPKELKRNIAFMNETFGTALEFWPRAKIRELYLSKRYYDAVYNPNSFHFHSLNFTRGTAAAAESLGVRIFEDTEATGLDLKGDVKRITTPQGVVTANQVVFCASGYMGWLLPRLRLSILPIGTYVMLTEPLGDRLKTAIRGNHAVADNRFAPDYYRALPDTSILWGGRISAVTQPKNLDALMMGDLLKVYPQLAGVKPAVSWPGTMGYTTHKMPLIAQMQPGVWVNTGFGGHGMCSTTAGGETVAKAIAEGDQTYRLFEAFGLTMAGGPVGPLVAQGVYWYWQLRDRLKR
ncbi:MAG: FAD-binding oxidoreductase [Alphaproteobacteria bacterium]|nr:FAD-binding oxidoreductase [Alphaproteobacteria bacterium]MBU0796709.1 FAD-binding oxidoreductase [Alphaproteobacteria bacterium]MBU0888258.1 FAD-binding oxidoreductase [Alphaproteobacteria bacterium]MBU1811459.1 FAD-binding oxidoreductase [Alphaproteobacteria bacterium]MBU2090469.1 FAD-binding oxidoreductase [Alphaproteobacteria bacterium]